MKQHEIKLKPDNSLTSKRIYSNSAEVKVKLKTMKNHQFNKIVNYLSVDEKFKFLNDLLESIAIAAEIGNWSEVKMCVEEWENVAELNSIPNFQNNTWQRFNRLKTEGRII
jgi:uncharacterized protein YaaR (DUF327 family)